MKKEKNLVFVVENDLWERQMIKDYFKENKHFEFKYFTNSETCFNALSEHPMAVLIDFDLNTINPKEKDGIKLLDEIKKLEHHTEVVFFSTHENTELAVATIKHGAFDYIVLNDNKFLKLENELNQILKHTFHKKEGGRYKKLFYATMIIGLAWVALVLVLVFMGVLKAGQGVWVEP